ncbi:MAG: hypothetical protein M3Z21_02860 [Pseudomonadota bacterium]|nr:hypothetical protein [Pseudomonadota bacterium]
MHALLNLFVDICLLRKGPQDLPASWALFRLSLAAYAASSLLFQAASVSFAVAVQQSLVDLALLAGLTYLVLNVLGFRRRFVQTLTALAGAGALLQLVAWPLWLWTVRAAAGDGAGALPQLLFLLLLLWNIAVFAHILRHALSTSRGMGLLYTLGYVIVSVTVMSLFFPS